MECYRGRQRHLLYKKSKERASKLQTIKILFKYAIELFVI